MMLRPGHASGEVSATDSSNFKLGLSSYAE